MATAAPNIELTGEQIPPLDFFRNDLIHDDNKKLIEQEELRFRLLTPRERRKLGRYVKQLRKRLSRAGYNQLTMRRNHLWAVYQDLVVEAKKAIEANQASHFFELQAKIRDCAIAGNQTMERLALLSEDHARYTHYRDWLVYERKHRAELKEEAKRNKEIRKGMRKEAKWIESLLLDVFRKTAGCHHIYKDSKGKEYTRTPRFERSMIEPGAHWFYLAASNRTLFGWRWLLPYNVNIANLKDEKTLENMRAATKRDVQIAWSDQGQMIFKVSRLDSPDALPKKVLWRNTRDYYPEAKRDKLPYCIGAGESRKLIWFDFASDPHVLIAGKTQSGKSNLVNGIIASNVATHTPDELRLVLIDQKGGMEFTHWSELPHLLWDVAKTVDAAYPMLNRIFDLMKKRMALLEQAKAKEIAAYNARHDKKLPRVIIIIDEMQNFVGMGTRTEEIHNLIMLIASMGRAVGIHLIAATQHPEVRVIPGRIKTNMPVRISGAMPSVGASMIVLDQPDAARLPNVQGRFVAVVGMKTIMVQVPLIEDEDIKMVVNKAKLDYQEISDELEELTNAPKLKIWDETAVIRAALEWTEGHLSGQKIHNLLGNESPGERELSKICRRVIDRASAANSLIEHEGTSYKVVKVKRAYILKSDQPDKKTA